MSDSVNSTVDATPGHEPNRVSRSVYGLVTVIGVLQIFQDHAPHGWQGVVVLFGTTFAVALLEVYSELIDDMIRQQRSLTRDETRRLARAAGPVFAGAQGPTIILALAAMGIISAHRAVDVAEAVAFISLFGFGFRAGRGAHRHWLRQIGTGLGLVAIGVVIVVIKVAVH
jgi:hypothetical protein